MARIIDDESDARENETRYSVKLNCQQALVGNRVHVRGDTVALLESQAQFLCANGLAEPVGISSWFKMPAKPKPKPAPEVPERWDEPGDGRPYKCEVVAGKEKSDQVWDGERWKAVKTMSAGKSIFVGDRSYGGGSIVYLSEADARIHLKAGNISSRIEPALPVRREPVKLDRMYYDPGMQTVGYLRDADAR